MPLTLTTAVVALIGGGIVEIFPKLRFGLLETGCGWLPYWVERLDEMHERGEKDPRMYEGRRGRSLHHVCFGLPTRETASGHTR